MKSATKAVSLGFVALVCFIFANVRAQAQTLFASEYWNGNIDEFTTGGVETTFANVSFAGGGLAFDSAGDLFAAHFGSGGPIYEYMTNGTSRIFASGSGLYPLGLAFNSAGDLFDADYGSGNIYEFTPNGTRSTFASGLANPWGLAFNSAGNLFVTAVGGGSIYEFTTNGTRSTFASGLSGPQGLAFNSAGDLFESEGNTGNIYEFTPNGGSSTFASLPSRADGLAFNSAGDLFASANGTIYEFTPNGGSNTFASGVSSYQLAFQDITLPVPEPSALALLAVATVALVGGWRLRRR